MNLVKLVLKTGRAQTRVPGQVDSLLWHIKSSSDSLIRSLAGRHLENKSSPCSNIWKHKDFDDSEFKSQQSIFFKIYNNQIKYLISILNQKVKPKAQIKKNIPIKQRYPTIINYLKQYY